MESGPAAFAHNAEPAHDVADAPSAVLRPVLDHIHRFARCPQVFSAKRDTEGDAKARAPWTLAPNSPYVGIDRLARPGTEAREQDGMFIAMNRFKIRPGEENAFERMWLDREIHINRTPGFREFHLLKGPKTDEYTLYSSHTVWASREAFEDWTRSDAFRAAHKDAGASKPTYIGHPEFEGFEVIQTVVPEPA